MSKSAQAFPLSWPAGRPRTKVRFSSRFGDKSVATAIKPLKAELSRLGASYIVISTNIPLKVNGDPYSDPGRMPDPGCAVYFQLKSKPYCLPCDRWDCVEDNLYAVAKHVEAMRGMERWGVSSVEQAFAGFKELPATAGDSEPWTTVLGIPDYANAGEIKAAHRVAAQSAHPDRGGSAEQMARINVARDRALAEVQV